MSGSENGRFAAWVIDQHCAFEPAPAGSRRRHPTREFTSSAALLRQPANAMPEDETLTPGVVSVPMLSGDKNSRERHYHHIDRQIILPNEGKNSVSTKFCSSLLNTAQA